METLHTWWATELYPMRERDQFGVSGEFEVALAADAQATIAALQARVQELEARQHFGACAKCLTNAWRICKEGTPDAVEMKCSNGSTWWLCDYCLSKEQLTQRTAELEVAKRLATNAQWQIDYVLDEAKKAFDLKGHYTPSDLVDCVLRPAASMLKERDVLKAELERVRGELAETKEEVKCLDEQVSALNQGCLEYERLIAALPKVEGEIRVIEVATDEWHVYDTIFATKAGADNYAALLQHRQGMEGVNES